MKEYAIYPFKFMNITQRHDQGNHINHWKQSTNYSDKPWDEAGKDSGQDVFSPMNDFKIIKILGLNSSTTNTIILQSVNKLYMPYKKEADYLFLTLTHINESDLKNLKVGQIIKKGEQNQFIREGTDGYATGNHFHITANLGKYYGLLQNSNGSWCYTYDKSLLPNEAFYIDLNHTIIHNAKSYSFQIVPEIYKYGFPVARNEYIDQVEILVDNVIARSTPRIKDDNILGYMNKGIYNVNKMEVADGYVWYENNDFWFAFSTEWCRLLPKKDLNQPIKEDLSQKQNNTANKKGSIFAIFINLIKKIFRIKS